MSPENDRSERGSKRSEHTPAPQVWVSGEKVVTLQSNDSIEIYSERNLRDGSVKTQFFIKTGKP
jgi:hypothetical protein